MKKALAWSLSIGAAAACLALTVPGAAVAAPSAASKAAFPTFPGRLYGVTAVSAHDIWAVGLTPSSALIVNWNGSTWKDYQPTLGFFEAVAHSSARDVWAVGGTNWFSPAQTYAEHWNGSRWSRVSTPNPPGGGYLIGVTQLSSRSAWAVGLAGPGPGVASPTEPLIEHWNGSRWTIQKVPALVGGGELDAVQAISSSNAWAVGWAGPASRQQTLIEHWNGRTWTRVASPVIGLQSFLHSVTVISSGNAWAVGSYQAADGTNKTLSAHWNGRHWSLVPSATPGGDAEFLGVTASWTNNIWAVGITNPARCGGGSDTPNCQTLVEHWNSVRWKVVPSPNPPAGYLNVLLATVAVNRGDIWAVGSTDYGSTLIVHWNGTSWS